MKTIQVAAAVIRKGEMIFAAQRGYGEFKDWWEFPGMGQSRIPFDDALLLVQSRIGITPSQ